MTLKPYHVTCCNLRSEISSRELQLLALEFKYFKGVKCKKKKKLKAYKRKTKLMETACAQPMLQGVLKCVPNVTRHVEMCTFSPDFRPSCIPRWHCSINSTKAAEDTFQVARRKWPVQNDMEQAKNIRDLKLIAHLKPEAQVRRDCHASDLVSEGLKVKVPCWPLSHAEGTPTEFISIPLRKGMLQGLAYFYSWDYTKIWPQPKKARGQWAEHRIWGRKCWQKLLLRIFEDIWICSPLKLVCWLEIWEHFHMKNFWVSWRVFALSQIVRTEWTKT